MTNIDWRRYIGRIVYAYEVEIDFKGEPRHVESTWTLVAVLDDGIAIVNDSLDGSKPIETRHFAIEQLRTYNKRANARKKKV